MTVAILQQWVMVGVCWRNNGDVVSMRRRWAVLLTSHWVEAIVLVPGTPHNTMIITRTNYKRLGRCAS